MCSSEGNKYTGIPKFKSSHPEVFLRKAVLKICSKFTGEHPCRNTISINVLVCNFIEIAFRDGCSLLNLLYKRTLEAVRNHFNKTRDVKTMYGGAKLIGKIRCGTYFVENEKKEENVSNL